MRTYSAIACLVMHEKRRRVIMCDLLLSLGLGTTCASAPARAHPAAAESPTFLDAPCVVVADKRAQGHLDISYSVWMDDTAIEAGDIPVSDAKTHQFFALAGTIYTIGVDDLYVPFTDLEGRGVVYPLWITHKDVQRSAAAVELATGVTADQTDLPPARVLETRPDLEGSWLRITADDARRPITASQALHPVRWMLADVPAGVYTVAGYVFSPPYNAWAPRPGVVKVIDAAHNPAAGALERVNEVVFAYQGRRVKGCVDVPDDTKLDAYYFVEEKPDLGWISWVQDKAVQTGDHELCFHVDRTDIAGSIRVRWDLRAADGSVTTLRTKDTFTWLQGSGACQESETHCCDFARTTDRADAGAAGARGEGGAAADAAGPTNTPAAESGGCAIATPRAARAKVAWLVLVAIVGCFFRRQRRASADHTRRSRGR